MRDSTADERGTPKTPRKPIVVSDEWEVRQELRTLGLSQEFVKKIAEAVASAKADTLRIDPANASGTQGYHFAIRNIRLMLIPEGWEVSRDENVESTVHHDLGVRLCYQNVYEACAAADPASISVKGEGARKLVRDGYHPQFEMFERESDPAKSSRGAVPVVWVLCVSTSNKRLRAEVSCPEEFEGNQFDGFSKRIFVVDEPLAPTPEPIEQVDDPRYEVRIARKA